MRVRLHWRVPAQPRMRTSSSAEPSYGSLVASHNSRGCTLQCLHSGEMCNPPTSGEWPTDCRVMTQSSAHVADVDGDLRAAERRGGHEGVQVGWHARPGARQVIVAQPWIRDRGAPGGALQAHFPCASATAFQSEGMVWYELWQTFRPAPCLSERFETVMPCS